MEEIFKDMIEEEIDDGENIIKVLNQPKVKDCVNTTELLSYISMDDYYNNDIDINDFDLYEWLLIHEKESNLDFFVLCDFESDDYISYLIN